MVIVASRRLMRIGDARLPGSSPVSGDGAQALQHEHDAHRGADHEAERVERRTKFRAQPLGPLSTARGPADRARSDVNPFGNAVE